MPYFFAPVGREQLDVLGNPAGNALYGTEPIENMGNAIIRGMKAGAAGGGLGYLAGLMEQGSGWGRTGNGLLTGMAGKTASAFIPRRDPGKGCGGISPFLQFLGYSSAKGYRYTPLQTGGVKRNREKFSIWKFFGSALYGAAIGGVSSAALYGAGKGIEKLWNGFRAGNRADFYVTPNGDVVPSTGYRYMSRNAGYIPTLKETMEIPANDKGTYITFDRFDMPAPEKLQVPHDASIRGSFDTLQIIDDIRTPNGMWGKAGWLEPITKDFPEYGSGGATQAVTNQKIVLDRIDDLLKGRRK